MLCLLRSKRYGSTEQRQRRVEKLVSGVCQVKLARVCCSYTLRQISIHRRAYQKISTSISTKLYMLLLYPFFPTSSALGPSRCCLLYVCGAARCVPGPLLRFGAASPTFPGKTVPQYAVPRALWGVSIHDMFAKSSLGEKHPDTAFRSHRRVHNSLRVPGTTRVTER